jgi:putative two-component system response regulator
MVDNRKLLSSIIARETDYEIVTAKSGGDVIEMLMKEDSDLPDLILMDVMMPEINGFETVRILKKTPRTAEIPVIFITGLDDAQSIMKAFEAGGIDYITKPFNKNELIARVNTHLKLVTALKDLEYKNGLLMDREKQLSDLVEEKTKKLDNITLAMVAAFENVNLLNDTDTGKHIKRVREYSVLLAGIYGCDNEFVKKIQIYSSLHDVGKVSMPDELLKKQGIFDKDEAEKMKQHVAAGFKMLDSPDIDMMAKNIVLYHHEKWDGTGYLKNLKGYEIPLEARIVAFADVYDALTTGRVYKKPFTEEETESVIKSSSGKHFEPRIVEVFFDNREKFIEIMKKNTD